MVRLLSLAACTATAACAASSLLVVGASFVLGCGLARALSVPVNGEEVSVPAAPHLRCPPR